MNKKKRMITEVSTGHIELGLGLIRHLTNHIGWGSRNPMSTKQEDHLNHAGLHLWQSKLVEWADHHCC